MLSFRRGLGLIACSLLAPLATAETITVHVFNFDYSVNPAGGPVVDPVIQLGDTIQWVWDNGFHNVQSVNGIPEQYFSEFRSAPYTFEHTFSNIGDWQYFCALHGFDRGDGTAGGMAGTIHVVPEPASGSLLALAGGLLALRRR